MAGGITELNNALQKLLSGVKLFGGATTPEEALAALGAMGNMELLWENASPTSAISSATMTLAHDDYDFLLWLFCIKTTYPDVLASVIVPKGKSGRCTTIIWPGNVEIGGRSVTYKDDLTYTCGQAVLLGFNGTTPYYSLENTYMIPLRAYGFNAA